MPLNHTQKEVELKVAEILKDGDIKDISNESNIGYSYIDQQLNPNDPRQSFIYGFLRIQCAYDATHPERGDLLWRLVKTIREASKPTCKTSCANVEAGKFAKESGEAISARLSNKDLYEQLREAVEAEEQARKLKEAVIAEINQEKESFNSDRPRLKAVK